MVNFRKNDVRVERISRFQGEMRMRVGYRHVYLKNEWKDELNWPKSIVQFYWKKVLVEFGKSQDVSCLYLKNQVEDEAGIRE